MKKNKFMQNVLLQLLGIWGFLSIVVCAVEDIPGQTMDDALFFGSKTIGITSFALCCLTGRYLSRMGWLPKIKEED